MFLGTYNSKILPGKQVVLPAKLRNVLGSSRAIITTGFDVCINGFSVKDWESISGQELTKPVSTAEGRRIRQKMFAGASEVDLDDQGRFVIPENLRQHAKLESKLVIIGAGDHFEIWDEDKWNALQQELAAQND